MKEMRRPFTWQWILMGTGLAALLFTLVYGSAGWGFLLLSIGMMLVFEYFFAFSKHPGVNPYYLMNLSPLLLLKYSSITDFRIRVLCFMLLVYLWNAAYHRGVRQFRFSLAKAKPLTVWLTAFLIFALAAGVLTMQGIHLSGDEPHYIMITQSLVEDGDFDLKNNMDEKTYYRYLPVELRFHGGDHKGKYRSFHLPGVSLLLIPFYWLFHIVSLGEFLSPALYFRLAAAVINSFFALCLFMVLKRKFPDKDITGFWLLALSLYPLVFHAVHLYPELPAATFMMAAYLFTFGEKKHYLWAGLCLSLVPWFHVKYIPPLLLLTAAILYRLSRPLKPLKPKIKRVMQLLIFPVLGAILLVIYSKTLYGSYSPTEIFPKESYWSVPWLLRLKVFLAYFLDQRDGLLFYSPLFFLFFFSFKKRLKGQFLLLGIASVYVFFHAFTTVRGAYSPAGRPLLFASWIFILFIAHFYFQTLEGKTGPSARFSYRLLAGLSFFVLVWLVYYPLFLYQPVFAGTLERASGLNLFLGSDFVPLWQFFPSFLTSPTASHPANFAWLGFLIAALLFFYPEPWKRMQKPLFTRAPAIMASLLFLLSAFFYCFYPHVHLIHRNKHQDDTISFYNNSRNFRYDPGNRAFRIKAGNRYDLFIDPFRSREDDVIFHFTSADASDVIVRNGKRLLYHSGPKGQKEISIPVRLSSLTTLQVKNQLVSHLGIETRSRRENSFLSLEIRRDGAARNR
jgi:hypothetical protein